MLSPLNELAKHVFKELGTFRYPGTNHTYLDCPDVQALVEALETYQGIIFEPMTNDEFTQDKYA